MLMREVPGVLIEQLFAAVTEWEHEPNNHAGEVVSWAMYWTGGIDHFETVGKVDPLSLPPEERHRLTAGDVHGQWTADQLRQRLLGLIEDGFDEEFLVVSIVRAMDSWLDEGANGYARVAARRRRMREHVESMLADPEQRESWLQEVRRNTPDWDPTRESDDEIVDAFLASVYQLTTPSPAEMKANLERLSKWREVTAPILDRDNLELARWGLPRA